MILIIYQEVRVRKMSCRRYTSKNGRSVLDLKCLKSIPDCRVMSKSFTGRIFPHGKQQRFNLNRKHFEMCSWQGSLLIGSGND